jgi:hypothetical protein
MEIDHNVKSAKMIFNHLIESTFRAAISSKRKIKKVLLNFPMVFHIPGEKEHSVKTSTVAEGLKQTINRLKIYSLKISSNNKK